MSEMMLKRSTMTLLTSARGEKMTPVDSISFEAGRATDNYIEIRPDLPKQRVWGIGTSFTESAAFTLATLEPKRRAELMARLFSADGADFALGRAPIGSTDFSLTGNYSYVDRANDFDLSSFSVALDEDGFSAREHPEIEDESFDILPMIKEAIAIKRSSSDGQLNIIASPWSAPFWMKDINAWSLAPGEHPDYPNGTGGALKPDCHALFADYLIRYIEAYKERGVKIWGITPVNEPLGNNGQWESMHFSPEEQNDFIKRHLGPKARASGNDDLRIYIYDHNRTQLEAWADIIYADPETARYLTGAATHWYDSSYKVYEDVFERVHAKYPNYEIINTEACIDSLGVEPPPTARDPKRYKESDWFDNDEFWWSESATDWAYSLDYPGAKSEDHPIYAPTSRYARDIIVSFNHWVSGWIDWNLALDKRGGPNHARNHCGAPIMIDTDSGYVYYTPVFYILAQLSRAIRPGARMLTLIDARDKPLKNSVHACASIGPDRLLNLQIFNAGADRVEFNVQIGARRAVVSIEGNTLQSSALELR